MFNFSPKFAWAVVLSVALVLSSLSSPSSGLSCWECDDKGIDRDPHTRICGERSGNGKSTPCTIPNGMCVSECVFEKFTDIVESWSRQYCSNDTSIVGEPGKCGKGKKELDPELTYWLDVCSCTTDDCNWKLSCDEGEKPKSTTEKPTSTAPTSACGACVLINPVSVGMAVIAILLVS